MVSQRLCELLLVISTSASVMSLSYNVGGSRTLTFYALNEKPVRLTYRIPSSETLNALSFTWTITLENGTILNDVKNSSQSSDFSITSGNRDTTLTIVSFGSRIKSGSMVSARAVFSSDPFTRTSAQVTILEGHLPNLTVAEVRRTEESVVVIVNITGGVPPSPDSRPTLLPQDIIHTSEMISSGSYKFTFAVTRLNYMFVANSALGNLSVNYTVQDIGLEKVGNCTSLGGDTNVTVQCSFALFPNASVTLRCPTVTRGVFSANRKVGRINADRLFQVDETFVTDNANGPCNRIHVCNLRVSSIFETKAYDEKINFSCPFPPPLSTIATAAVTPSLTGPSLTTVVSSTPTTTSMRAKVPRSETFEVSIAVGSAVGGVILIILLILLFCAINLSCRRWLQRVCCSCCFRCYDNCCGTQCDGEAPDESKATCCRGCYNCWACCFNCCNGSHNGRKKESVPMEDVEEAEPYATSPGAPAAASSKKKEDEVEPYGMSGGAVSDTKEKKSKPAPKSAAKEEYAKPDVSKKSKKKAAQQAPTGGDVYAQVDKKKKDEKGDVNYAALDHSGSKSATLQSASNEGGVVYSQVQKN